MFLGDYFRLRRAPRKAEDDETWDAETDRDYYAALGGSMVGMFASWGQHAPAMI